MSRKFDLTEVKESNFINIEGEFVGTISAVTAGVASTGTEFDKVTIDIDHEGTSYIAMVSIYIPQEMTPQKMGFLKRQWRLCGIDVDSGEADIADAVGNEVKVKVVLDTYNLVDEMGDPTGETKETYKVELIENV